MRKYWKRKTGKKLLAAVLCAGLVFAGGAETAPLAGQQAQAASAEPGWNCGAYTAEKQSLP